MGLFEILLPLLLLIYAINFSVFAVNWLFKQSRARININDYKGKD